MVSLTNFKLHMKLKHGEDEQVPCDVCGRTFKCRDFMLAHYKRIHGNMGKEHKCSQCDKTYKYAISLREHVRIAHEGGTNAYSCEQCGKTFDREST